MTKQAATAQTIAAKMLSFKGKAHAATAAAPAIAADTMRRVEEAREAITPTKAKMPAKPKPHSVGIHWAKTTPITLAVIQER
jgi:hypothetical protein